MFYVNIDSNSKNAVKIIQNYLNGENRHHICSIPEFIIVYMICLTFHLTSHPQDLPKRRHTSEFSNKHFYTHKLFSKNTGEKCNYHYKSCLKQSFTVKTNFLF